MNGKNKQMDGLGRKVTWLTGLGCLAMSIQSRAHDVYDFLPSHAQLPFTVFSRGPRPAGHSCRIGSFHFEQ